MIICSGGGYSHLSDREDQPVAMEYLAAGFQVFCLHYSVAPDVFPRSLMELAMTVHLIRAHSEEWKVDPKRVVASGFSAGGHLACSLGAFYNQEFLYGPLGLTPDEIRPDGHRGTPGCRTRPGDVYKRQPWRLCPRTWLRRKRS